MIEVLVVIGLLLFFGGMTVGYIAGTRLYDPAYSSDAQRGGVVAAEPPPPPRPVGWRPPRDGGYHGYDGEPGEPTPVPPPGPSGVSGFGRPDPGKPERRDGPRPAEQRRT